METITPKPAKTWQKPDFYLLDSNSIEGGGVFGGAHEINNGNHSLIKLNSGLTLYNPGAYHNYQHS